MTRATSGRTRSRSALLWAAVAFVISQLFIGLLLDHVFTLVRFPSAASVMANLDSQPSSPDIIVFGSSRTGCSIYADEINGLLAAAGEDVSRCRVFNASVPVGDTIASEFLFDLTRQKGHLPRWILIEVSPETLNSPNIWMNAHVVRQLTWKEMPTHLIDAVRTNAGARYLGARLLPGLVHRQEILASLGEALKPAKPQTAQATGVIAAKGALDWNRLLQLPANPAPEERLKLIRRTVDINRWLRNFRIGGLSSQSLERMLVRCRNEGIGVVLLNTPVTSPHRAEHTPDIEGAYQEYIEGVCARYGCVFVDSRTWLPDELFRDCHHVDSANGVIYYSRMLTQRVLIPLLEQKQ